MRRITKKTMSWFVSCMMILSVLFSNPLTVLAQDGGGTPSTNIEFQSASISSGAATFVVGEASVSVVVSVNNTPVAIEDNGEHKEISVENSKFADTVFTLTGFNPETMDVVLRGFDGYTQVLSVTNNSASLAGLTLPSMVNFSVEAKNQSGPQNNPGQQGGELENGGQGGLEGQGSHGSEETINLSVTWTGNFGEIKIGGHSANLGSGQATFDSAIVNSDDKIEIIVQAPFAEDFNSIKLNGEEKFTGAMPEGKYIFYIPKTDTTLSIVATKAAATKGTIVWAYDDSMGADAKVENGTVEMVSEVEGTPGHYLVNYDEEVTIKLIPAYGYQVVGAMINGDVPLTANSAANEFKFRMPHTNVHFQGIFTRTEDIVANTTSAVSSATFAGDKVATSGGTAKMTLSDATPSDTSVLEANIDSSKSIQAVDISMDQLFYKNSASDVWSTNKSELDSEANVSLTVNQDAAGYAVLREHNGEVTEIPATYNSETHTISFASDKYSTYTLVPLAQAGGDEGSESEGGNTEGEGSESENTNTEGEGTETESGTVESETESSEATQTTPESLPEEPVTPPSLSAGTTVGGREIRTWNDLEEVLLAEVNSAAAVESELIQLTISQGNSAIPANIFTAIANTKETGLHLFAGSGTALTFINDDKLSSQKAVDLSCTTTESEAGKTILFKGNGKLSATAVLHSVAPKGSNKVIINLTDARGDMKKIFETIPNAEGRFCFAISELGKYDIEYK